MYLVAALLPGAIMHNVGHQVVGCPLLVLGLVLITQEVTKLDSLYREIDNGWVLLNKESILCEPFDEKNDKLREAYKLKFLEEVILVCLVFPLSLSVKLG